MGWLTKILNNSESLEPEMIIDETPLVLSPPKQILAVEHAHGVVTRALATWRAEEATLEKDIAAMNERLRQVRVTIHAMSGAYDVLDADFRNGDA